MTSSLPDFFVIVLLCGDSSILCAQNALKTPDPKPAETVKAATAEDFNPKALWDGRKLVPFRALDFPKMVPVSEAGFLGDGDYILAVSEHGESRAYPTRFIWWHHVINDKIGKLESGGEEEVAITYCSVCNTGIRYDRTLDGKPVKLDFHGLYNGVVTLCERESASVFLQADGRFVTGNLSGKVLRAGPVLDTTWGQWKKLHPDTLVMSPDSPDQKYYNPKNRPEPRGHDSFPSPFFQSSMTRTDKRLPFFEKVLGVAMTGPDGKVTRRAYPLKVVKAAGFAVNDVFGSNSVAVLLEPESMTAVAVLSQLDGRKLTFESRAAPDGGPKIFDKETGTRWNIEGRGEEGPLKGRSLARLNSHLSQWYGWVAYFPETGIYGRTDPPQSENITVSEPRKGEKP
jgi:hypothetical protein